MREPRKITAAFQDGTCPLRCKKCVGLSPNQTRKLQVAKMPLENAKQIIDEMAVMEHIPILAPNFFAEPFTNPDLQEIIRYSAEKKVPLSIITNGILLSENWIAFLNEILDRHSAVSVSLDAVSQEVYEQVRGKYQLSEVEEKICRLIETRKEGRGPRVTVNMTVEDENRHEVEKFIDKWKYVADGVRISIVTSLERKIPDQFKKDIKSEQRHGCANLDDMVIYADGHVRICCDDVFGDTDLGNVFEQGILGVWNSEKMNEYRQRIVSGNIQEGDFCYGCESDTMTGIRERETDDFIIKEADYWIFYNQKSRWIS